jgi:hypothetical protein
MTRWAITTTLLFLAGGAALGAVAPTGPQRPPLRIIDGTVIVGDSDPLLWTRVLEVLPARPERIEILDLASLSDTARRKLDGRDAFVLSGQRAIVVIRQGATLRQAEFGDGLDRLVLASLVWHELAHVNGADERAALDQERALWRGFIRLGLVSSSDGMAYIQRLREASITTKEDRDTRPCDDESVC